MVPLLLALPLLTLVPPEGPPEGAPQGPATKAARFTARDAIRAEWARRPYLFDDKARAALPEADRARELLTRQRIGMPGAPPLLPPELDQPDLATWEARAKKARSYEERFTALYFLNRLKSQHALWALDGLTAEDAKRWPKQLHLEGQIATARLRGEVVSADLAKFLAALQVDPVRAQAARLRLVLDGKETELLPPIEPTPGAVLAVMEAWNKGPWERRAKVHGELLDFSLAVATHRPPNSLPVMTVWNRIWPKEPPGYPWSGVGLTPPSRIQPGVEVMLRGLAVRLIEGTPGEPPVNEWRFIAEAIDAGDLPLRTAAIATIGNLPHHLPPSADAEVGLRRVQRHLGQLALNAGDSRLNTALLPVLRIADPLLANALATGMLAGADAIARGAAIEDLAAPPADLDALAKRVFSDGEIDSLQALIAAFDRWKLAPDRRRSLLTPFLAHPTWIGRYEAWKALSALDPAGAAKTPWPDAPPPTATEKAILAEAERLADAGKPVRLRITFAEKRTIVLKLDPVNAPINVANLELLARRKFFDGRRVPRIVPDFVVQMGSPLDTMDGGPGYSVRCEDSLAWYGPGSVGMALGGKDTGGSQFFITLNATPHLTGRYTRVGDVEDPDRAMPILDALELGALIERIEVIE